MKKITLALSLMISINVFSQDTTSKLDTPFLRLSPQVVNGFNFKKTTKILFFGKELKTKMLEVRDNGDVYYTPQHFCDCDKCRSFIGMKFLTNFFNNK